MAERGTTAGRRAEDGEIRWSLSVILTVILNVAALIWGAATLSSRLSANELATARLTNEITSLQVEVVNLRIAVGGMEVRITNLETHKDAATPH